MNSGKEATKESTIMHHEFSFTAPKIVEDDGAIIFDLSAAEGKEGVAALKTAMDGHTVLVPQPSNDPDDPLNWSEAKKTRLLVVLGMTAFLSDFQVALAGAPVPAQSVEWQITPNHVLTSLNLAVLMIGIGGVFWIPFTYWWGRAPTLFWPLVVGTLFTLGTAVVPNFAGYYGLRALSCFFLAGPPTIAWSFIQDIFFLHQHARKLGVLTTFYLTSPYFGPMFGYYIVAKTGYWRGCFWLVFGLDIVCLVSVLLFVDETWYRRDIPQEEQPARGAKIWRILGVWQIQHHAGYFLDAKASIMRFVLVAIKPVVLLASIFTILTFMWAVGINTSTSVIFTLPVEAGGYAFGPLSIGYLYFAPIVGIMIGEVIGHFGNDWLATNLVRKRHGTFLPEMRLWAIYPALCLMIPGIVLVGQALQNHLTWAAAAIGWGMYITGSMISAVAISTYVLDSYGRQPGEVSSMMNLSRTLGGFSVGYFQLDWGLASGFATTFGVQGAVIASSVIPIICLQIWGARLRAKGGKSH